VPEFEANGQRLHYERRGEGEPLLLIMGHSGNLLHWGEPFLEAVAPDFELISFDNRGLGLSGPTADGFTVVDMAQDAAAVLDAAGIESAHVMGISMGGMIAQELVLARPDRVRTLVLGCSFCGGPGSRHTDQAVRQRIAEPALRGDFEGAVRASWETNVSATFAQDAGNWERFREIARRRRAPLGTLIAQLQAIAGHDTSARLGAVETSTLVIHGDADQILDVSNGRLIAQLIPGARLEVLEGVGHLFFWEEPERSARLVREHALAPAPQ
jgi:3-oxoadipate enol-lactonase